MVIPVIVLMSQMEEGSNWFFVYVFIITLAQKLFEDFHGSYGRNEAGSK